MTTSHDPLDLAAHRFGRVVRAHHEDHACRRTCASRTFTAKLRDDLGLDNIITHAIALGVVDYDTEIGAYVPGSVEPWPPYGLDPDAVAAMAARQDITHTEVDR